jgi:hypothetical protein
MGVLTRIRRVLSELLNGRQDQDPPRGRERRPAPVRTADLEEDKAKVRKAMVSVYYHSLGRQFELRGAPAMMLPQQATPLTLDEALEALAPWPDRVRDAAWRIVRAYPPSRNARTRYPPALAEAIDRLNAVEPNLPPLDLDDFDAMRRSSRFGAHLFAAALVACAEGQWPEFERVVGLMDAREREPSEHVRAFEQAAQIALGQNAVEFLRSLQSAQGGSNEAKAEIGKLEFEVGLNIYDFVEDFADAIAFEEFWPTPRDRPVVYPACSVITQDTSTMTTTATVTTLIRGKFDMLKRAVDPQCWPLASDVMKSTCYVKDPFAPKRMKPFPTGETLQGPELLLESCELSWGGDASTSTFNQILRIGTFSVREEDEENQSIELQFSLSRSLDSRVLWDARSGGLRIDEGYIKVRQISPAHWRVTSRKVLNFSDRTPNSAPIAGFDFGEMLNYLAPAAMIWWVESEMYSTACDVYADEAQFKKGLATLYASEDTHHG